MKLKAKSYNKGEVVLSAVVFFLVSFMIVITGVTLPIMTDLAATRESYHSIQSFALAEGIIEDVGYRLLEGMAVSAIEALNEGGTTASAVITSPAPDQREVLSSGITAEAVRKARINLVVGTGAGFNFGVQTDVGGLLMEQSSTITGDVYSNGTVEARHNNTLTGNVISAGPNGLIDGVHVTESAYSYEIDDSWIEGDAHYQVIDVSTTVDGTKYPGSPILPQSSLPITDAQVAAWEAEAEAGGTISSPCPGGVYKINSNTTIGPIKIDCDLEFSGNNQITLTGSIWVVGDIIFKNNPYIKIDPSVGQKSLMIIADDPANRLNKSTITVPNNPDFEGSGAGRSYVLLISMNESAEQGGNVTAVDLKQGPTGDVLVYAGHGEVLLKQHVSLKEVTGWLVHLQESAEVTYESGLANLIFLGGPTAGFAIDRWVEEP
jgi:hypothetical protein